MPRNEDPHPVRISRSWFETELLLFWRVKAPDASRYTNTWLDIEFTVSMNRDWNLTSCSRGSRGSSCSRGSRGSIVILSSVLVLLLVALFAVLLVLPNLGRVRIAAAVKAAAPSRDKAVTLLESLLPESAIRIAPIAIWQQIWQQIWQLVADKIRLTKRH